MARALRFWYVFPAAASCCPSGVKSALAEIVLAGAVDVVVAVAVTVVVVEVCVQVSTFI